MEDNLLENIARRIGANSASIHELIQELWSGYGQLLRIRLEGAADASIIVKRIQFPQAGSHPRGWNTNLSHERKVKSYQVETTWYKNFADQCVDECRVPRVLDIDTKGDEVLVLLEDLNEVGFPLRKSSVSMVEVQACIQWLANFHAIFLHVNPDGLWATGTYWHLETRPEELEALEDLELKNAATWLDKKLSSGKYQTLVHGDAKLANFCFSNDGSQVAAVDFQYVGGGCGMKDLAYFIGSCVPEDQCEELEEELLDRYFDELRKALSRHKGNLDSSEIEKEWRALYRIAWTDFHRFLKGWSPGHWKINDYSEKVAREVIAQMQNEK